MLTPDSPLTYKIDNLLTVFQAALANKQAVISKQNLGAWACEYPGAHSRYEQEVVDALQSWKKAGAQEIVTAHILSDPDPTKPSAPTIGGDVNHSFFMQLKNNQIKPL